MLRYYFRSSAPDARFRDRVGCEVSDLSVTRPHARACGAHYAGWMSLSRVVNRASLTASLLFIGSTAFGDTRALMLHHVHTDEKLTITYKKDGQYDNAALKKINWIMRDWRRNEATIMDPKAIDLLWEVYHGVGAKGPIQIIGGYRSPSTNEMLRTRGPRSGVALHSLHMFGKAIDFYIPGVSLAKVRETAMRLQGGGVGYYPTSGSPFVHLDVGNVSAWPRMKREQLVKLFPDGRTTHPPADGTPLVGYELARADIEHGAHRRAVAEFDEAELTGFGVQPKQKRRQHYHPRDGGPSARRECQAHACGQGCGGDRRLLPWIRPWRLPHPLRPVRVDVASRVALLTRDGAPAQWALLQRVSSAGELTAPTLKNKLAT